MNPICEPLSSIKCKKIEGALLRENRNFFSLTFLRLNPTRMLICQNLGSIFSLFKKPRSLTIFILLYNTLLRINTSQENLQYTNTTFSATTHFFFFFYIFSFRGNSPIWSSSLHIKSNFSQRVFQQFFTDGSPHNNHAFSVQCTREVVFDVGLRWVIY